MDLIKKGNQWRWWVLVTAQFLDCCHHFRSKTQKWEKDLCLRLSNWYWCCCRYAYYERLETLGHGAPSKGSTLPNDRGAFGKSCTCRVCNWWLFFVCIRSYRRKAPHLASLVWAWGFSGSVSIFALTGNLTLVLSWTHRPKVRLFREERQ